MDSQIEGRLCWFVCGHRGHDKSILENGCVADNSDVAERLHRGVVPIFMAGTCLWKDTRDKGLMWWRLGVVA
jgi:hypothetical protein